MGSLCLSNASILRCESFSRSQVIVLIVPTVIEVVFSSSLIFTNWGAGSRHLWLVVEGWVYFTLAMLEMLSHLLPSVQQGAKVFRAIDTVLAAASFIPILFYIIFLYLFTHAELIDILPARFRRLAKGMVLLFIPAIVVFNELASFLGISYRTIRSGSMVTLLIGFASVKDETLWTFFTSLTLALLTAYQAVHFIFAFHRLVKAILDQRSIEATQLDGVHFLRGIGWLSAGFKLGAIETVIGFANAGFGGAFTRRLFRMLARGFLCVGVIKGPDFVEDFARIKDELQSAKRSRPPEFRRSRLREFISNPRFSTFRQLTPTATAFHSAPRAPSNLAHVVNASVSSSDARRHPRLEGGLQGMRDFGGVKDLVLAGAPELAKRQMEEFKPSKERVTVLFSSEGAAPSLHMRFSTLDFNLGLHPPRSKSPSGPSSLANISHGPDDDPPAMTVVPPSTANDAVEVEIRPKSEWLPTPISAAGTYDAGSMSFSSMEPKSRFSHLSQPASLLSSLGHGLSSPPQLKTNFPRVPNTPVTPEGDDQPRVVSLYGRYFPTKSSNLSLRTQLAPSSASSSKKADGSSDQAKAEMQAQLPAGPSRDGKTQSVGAESLNDSIRLSAVREIARQFPPIPVAAPEPPPNMPSTKIRPMSGKKRFRADSGKSFGPLSDQSMGGDQVRTEQKHDVPATPQARQLDRSSSTGSNSGRRKLRKHPPGSGDLVFEYVTPSGPIGPSPDPNVIVDAVVEDVDVTPKPLHKIAAGAVTSAIAPINILPSGGDRYQNEPKKSESEESPTSIRSGKRPSVKPISIPHTGQPMQALPRHPRVFIERRHADVPMSAITSTGTPTSSTALVSANTQGTLSTVMTVRTPFDLYSSNSATKIEYEIANSDVDARLEGEEQREGFVDLGMVLEARSKAKIGPAQSQKVRTRRSRSFSHSRTGSALPLIEDEYQADRKLFRSLSSSTVTTSSHQHEYDDFSTSPTATSAAIQSLARIKSVGKAPRRVTPTPVTSAEGYARRSVYVDVDRSTLGHGKAKSGSSSIGTKVLSNDEVIDMTRRGYF